MLFFRCPDCGGAMPGGELCGVCFRGLVQIEPVVDDRLVWAMRPPDGSSEITRLVILFGGDRAHCCDEAAVCYDGETVVGACTLSPSGEQGHGPEIVGLYVRPKYRRRGIARRLLAAIVARAEARGLAPLRANAISSAGYAALRTSPSITITSF